jgi:hypothetical protein
VLKVTENTLQERYNTDVKQQMLQNLFQDQEDPRHHLPCYIHVSNQKKACNYIKTIKVNGNTVTEPARVREEVLRYYADF